MFLIGKQFQKKGFEDMETKKKTDELLILLTNFTDLLFKETKTKLPDYFEQKLNTSKQAFSLDTSINSE